MEHNFLRFLNLEFWYCVVYSLFGGKCAPVKPVDVSIAPGAPSTAGQITEAGFFGIVIQSASAAWHVVGGALGTLWSLYSTFAYTASLLLALCILGSLGGLMLIRMRDRERYGTLPPESKDARRLRARWDALLDDVMSQDPKKWRESIIAADALLGELLGNLGYRGEETTQMLRSVPEGAFVTLPAAWEAHRVKNFIVSGASDFILTQREAFRVMKLYEQVFEEFKFV